MMMEGCNLLIAIAYFSIPLQILWSLYKFPKPTAPLPKRLIVISVLFALFIFSCGTGHFLMSLDMSGTRMYRVTNIITAIISVTTAICLLPGVSESVSTFLLASKAEERLQEETAAKRKLFTFMAFLCHEIRNPLFAITSTLSFLGDDDLTEEQEKALNAIRDSANLMLRIVNDVLDLSRLDSGKLQLENHYFDVRQTLHNVAMNMETQCVQKHGSDVQFQFHLAPDVPRFVCADSARILQIVYNLLSNALKFTQQGYIRCSVSVYDRQEALRDGLIGSQVRGRLVYTEQRNGEGGGSTAQDFSVGLLQAVEEGRQILNDSTPEGCNEDEFVMEIKVQDTGEGIPEERIKNIFEPYSQSKLSDYRKHGGTGLGLSILQKLAVMMNGTIHVTSKLGEGSTFVVYLPIRADVDKNNQFKDNKTHDSSSATWDRTESTIVDSTILSVENDSSNDLLALSNNSSSKVPLLIDATTMTSATTTKPILATPPCTCHHSKHNSCSELSNDLSNGNNSHGTKTYPLYPKSSLPPLHLVPNQNMVLVTDDNEMNRKILSRMLQAFQIPHEMASNGKEAVDKILASRNYTGQINAPYYGLILMDLMMPVMGGCEAIQILRAHHITIPIIALTANALDEDRHKALRSGATEFVTKPILREELYSKCCHYLLPTGSALLSSSTAAVVVNGSSSSLSSPMSQQQHQQQQSKVIVKRLMAA